MNVGDKVRSTRDDNAGALGTIVKIDGRDPWPIRVQYEEGSERYGLFNASELEQVTKLEEVEKIVADLQNTVVALSEKLDTLAVIVLRLLEQ